MSNGCVKHVASNPAIAPEGIDSNGPEDGEFKGEANMSKVQISSTSNKRLRSFIQGNLNSSIGRISQRRRAKSGEKSTDSFPLEYIRRCLCKTRVIVQITFESDFDYGYWHQNEAHSSSCEHACGDIDCGDIFRRVRSASRLWYQ